MTTKNHLAEIRAQLTAQGVETEVWHTGGGVHTLFARKKTDADWGEDTQRRAVFGPLCGMHPDGNWGDLSTEFDDLSVGAEDWDEASGCHEYCEDVDRSVGSVEDAVDAIANLLEAK